ncbi:MAG: DUF4493 domain-containing protein [Muribaculaceae bacterium]|nr:DUF4493 domain-containing protein [Muribaculaceae bacterium]
MSKFSKGLLLFTSVAALGLAACSDESPWSGSDSVGGIHLNLETDGRIMKHATKSDDSMSPVVPDGNAFAIALNHVDGSYSKSWSNIEAFNNEESFPIGDYKINATYGELGREGFGLPCFMAEEDVHVAPGANAEVSMVATLANSMVSIRYNDDFINNFPQYSAAVQTPGKDWVVFSQNETRPAYMDPSEDGNTKVSITMFNKNNEKVTIEPAKFKIQPRRHYIVTINAVGNISQGNLALQVEFEEDVVSESVEINLTDELFSSPAPEIKPKNFTVGQPVTFIANEELSSDPQFDIFSFGGFEEVTMNVAGPSNYTPIFGKSVEFLSADDVTRKNMEHVGVNVSGLYPVSGLMAVINIKKYLEQVPAGDYTITLQAKDKLTRLSDPVVLTAKVNPFVMDVTQGGDVPYRTKEIEVIVASNSTHFANNLIFDLRDKYDNPLTFEVKSIEDASVEGYASAKKCTLVTDPVVVEEVLVHVSCGRAENTLTIDVVDPEYNVEVDAFAKHVILRVSAPQDPDLENDLVDNLVIYSGSKVVESSRIIRNKERNLIVIKDTDPDADYKNVRTVLGSFVKVLPTISTESDTDVENGDFVNRGTHIQFNNINVGGSYKAGTTITRTLTVNINRYEPYGWTSVNALTASSKANPLNTWFVVPSTYMENGAVVIRSVGYNLRGTVPATTSKTGVFWCTNSPTDDQLNKAAGELFLGNYSLNDNLTPVRSNGKGFSSRPSNLSFDYKYTPLNGERAQATIIVYDASGNVIVSEKRFLSATPDMEKVTIPLKEYPFGVKADKIFVGFRSTEEGVTPSIHIPTGQDALKEDHGLGTTLEENTYHALATGSVLIIDNVALGYDDITPVFNAPRRKVKR